MCIRTSNTDGFPGICHAGGAALLQQKKDLMLIKDMGPNSVYYQYTTVSGKYPATCASRLTLSS